MGLGSLKEALLKGSRGEHIDEVTERIMGHSLEVEEDIRSKARTLLNPRSQRSPQFSESREHTVDMSATCDFLLRCDTEKKRQGGLAGSSLQDIHFQFRNGERTRDLKEFLPVGKNIRFRYGKNLEYGPDSKIIFIPPNHPVDPYLPADLLHEIGHSHEENVPWSISQRIMENAEKVITTVGNILRPEVRRAAARTKLEGTSVRRIKDESKQKARNEIAAWRFAKDSLQYLQRDGFDVMSAYGEHGLDDFIRTALHDHQTAYERDLFISGGADALENCEDLFVWNE